MPHRRLVRKVRALAGTRSPGARVGGAGSATHVASPPKESPLAEPRRLVEAGRYDEAIEILKALNERSQSLQVEWRIVEARQLGARDLPRRELPSTWPPVYDDPFPDVAGTAPEIEARALTPEIMGGAIVNHGCLIVRGLISDEDAARARSVIDLAHDHWATFEEKPTATRWFHPVDVPGRTVENGVLRAQVGAQGGVWLNDSPAGAALLLGLLADASVVDAVESYLGERPVVSLQKSTLRKSDPEYRVVSWHQDGAFLDPDIRTVNVWVALSACGGDLPTPGLELAPRRVDHIVAPDGEELAANSLSGWAVHELLEGASTVVPEFQPGDAIIFDERFVHRTHLTPGMTEPRYALENWFFAPSSSVGGYDMLLP